ncbi:MAG TPA: hypothetical protein VFK80_07685 [Limnochordia bacterium]|nr:hypothetical protein [Limnochordia bacterium]
MVVAVWAGSASAGIRLTYDDGKEPSETLIQDGKLLQGSSLLTTVFNCKGGQISVWSNQSKSYWQGGLDEVAATFAGAQQRVQKMMAGLPQMSTKSAAPEKPRSLGAKKIAGYDANGYSISFAPMPMMKIAEEVWLSADLESEVNRELGSCDLRFDMPDMSALSPGMGEMQKSLAELQKEHGYVVSQSVNVGGRKTGSVLQKVEHVALAAAQFNPPAGYKRESSYGAFLNDAVPGSGAMFQG